MNCDVATTKANLALGFHSQRIERDILLMDVPTNLTRYFGQSAILWTCQQKCTFTFMTTLAYHSFFFLPRQAREFSCFHVCNAIYYVFAFYLA